MLEAGSPVELARLLTRAVPAVLSLPQAELLLWNRKLDDFLGLTTDETQLATLEPHGEGAAHPAAGFLISEGALLRTSAAASEGVLVPLLARSAVLGTWLLRTLPSRRKAPVLAREARLISVIATRAALAFENHLYQRELIASERMAVLGTMAGMLAHDFRGPMTVIRGYAETLMDGAVAPEVVQQRVGEIVRACDRLERMTAETLDFARGGAKLSRRRIDLGRWLDQLASSLEIELAGLEVVRRTESVSLVFGWLDTDKLRRALGNVAGNARDAMGGRGRLHLQARVFEREGAPWLELDLTDEGPGVPQEIRERLFEPFVTRGKRGGTGLGLAVTKRFVEDHGGTVELLLDPVAGEQGASFRLRLPLGEPSGTARPHGELR